MDSPYCSCKLTRGHQGEWAESPPATGGGGGAVAAGRWAGQELLVEVIGRVTELHEAYAWGGP